MAPAQRDRGDDADDDEQRVQMQAAVLHPSRARRRFAAPSAAMPFSVPSRNLAVAEAQEHAIGNPVQRPRDQAVVGLVDEILAGEQAMQRRRIRGAVRRRAVALPPNKNAAPARPGERERDRDEDERGLEVLELRRRPPGAGSSGSR